MAFTRMTAEELKANKIYSQDDKDLDLENGVFSKEGYVFISETIATGGNQFVREYSYESKLDDVPITPIFLISDVVADAVGKKYTRYYFYKEV